MDDVYALLAPYMHIIPWRALRPDDLVNHVKHGATKPHLIPCGRVRARTSVYSLTLIGLVCL